VLTIHYAFLGEYDDYPWVGPVEGPGGAALFFKSSATYPKIFRNLQLASRSFFYILSNRPEDFPESSARDPVFFLNLQQRDRTFFGIVRTRPEVFKETYWKSSGSAKLWKLIEKRGSVAPIPP